MNTEEKAYLKKAIKNGGVYTTPIHSIGNLYSQAIKPVTIAQPWGHPQGDIEGIISHHESKDSFPSVLSKTMGAIIFELILVAGTCKILIDLFNIF